MNLSDETKKKEVLDDLATLINKHSLENSCNTPDFIIAQHLWYSLIVLATTVNDRDSWYGSKIEMP